MRYSEPSIWVLAWSPCVAQSTQEDYCLVWSMLEKMVLIGLMGLWPSSTTLKAVNVLISTFSIVMIAWHIPSKTHECKRPWLPRLCAVVPTLVV